MNTENLIDASTGVRASLSMFDIARYMPRGQVQTLVEALGGQEAEGFASKVVELAELIEKMPQTHDQAGAGYEAVAHLHYFHGATDCYVFEKDCMGGVQQATALVILNGDVEMAEIGFVSITEMVGAGAELDLYFKPCTLAEIRKEKGLSI